ncbi:MAG: RNA polymerase sigma factor [Erysipelotrichaceae bacterium]
MNMHIKGIRTESQLAINELLMDKIACGDEEAFIVLYNNTSKSVYSYILALVRDCDLAEDFTQDTYISIRKNISQYQPLQKPMAWIFRIARNHVYSYFRKQKVTSEYNDEVLYDMSNFSVEKDGLDSIVLQTALQKLNQKERTIIILNAINGYKFREIAEYLEIPLGTVLASYHRGIFKLKSILKEIIE